MGLLDHSSDPPPLFFLWTPCLCPSEHIWLLEIILLVDVCPFITISSPRRWSPWGWHGHRVFLVLDSGHRASHCLKRKWLLPVLSLHIPTRPSSCSRTAPVRFRWLLPWGLSPVWDPQSKFPACSTVGNHTIIYVISWVLSSLPLVCMLPLTCQNDNFTWLSLVLNHNVSFWNYAQLCFLFRILAEPISRWTWNTLYCRELQSNN